LPLLSFLLDSHRLLSYLLGLSSLYYVPIASTSGTVVGRPSSMEVCNLFFLNFLFNFFFLNLISILIYDLNNNSIVSYTIPIPFWFWLMILLQISAFDSVCFHLQSFAAGVGSFAVFLIIPLVSFGHHSISLTITGFICRYICSLVIHFKGKVVYLTTI